MIARIAAIGAAALALSACTTTMASNGAGAVAPATVAAPVPGAPAVPAGMQYLYGSGEGAAASRQAYAALVAFLERGPRRSVVLAPGATLAAPRWADCGNRPHAIVLDVDETALLNIGYEYADAQGGLSYDAARWERWERSDGRATRAVPGAVEALAKVRTMGVTVIFNSNRNAANAAWSERVLAAAGLGEVRHGETLFLKGDVGGGSAKDARRAAISARYCVVAMAGDQLGDFSDLFNARLTPPERRQAADSAAVAPLWGAGWFVLPNPVYGTALAGNFDEVFPNDLRWTDPGATQE